MWNYLRVRGEYGGRARGSDNSLELPPRARRIHLLSVLNCVYLGTTSACAENTELGLNLLPRLRNYLRVRGEYKPSPPSCPP